MNNNEQQSLKKQLSGDLFEKIAETTLPLAEKDLKSRQKIETVTCVCEGDKKIRLPLPLRGVVMSKCKANSWRQDGKQLDYNNLNYCQTQQYK